MDACILIPEVNGEPSILYQELDKDIKDKNLTNYIYARYLVSGVAAQMDSAGYKRNKQGQHKLKDVKAFFEYNKIINETNRSIEADARVLGSMDAFNNYINFDNVEDAYNLAISFNNNHKGRVAYVIQHGDKFNIIIENKDSRTQIRALDVNSEMAAWGAFKIDLTNAGVNVDEFINISPALINPLSLLRFLDTMAILKTGRNDILSVKDIEIFLTLSKNNPRVQNLLNRGWGTIEEVAQKCYDALQDPSTVTPTLHNLIDNTITNAKNNCPFNFNASKTNIVNNVIPNYTSTDEVKAIQDVLNDLEQKYDITPNAINRKSKDIKTLKDAISDAITTITREIRVLESKGGVTAATKKLNKTREILAEELKSKRYYFGLIQFLGEALVYSKTIHNILASVPDSGTELENIRNRSEAISKAKSLQDGYYHIVEALANLDNLVIEENISEADKKQLQDKAKEVLELLNKQKGLIQSKQHDTVLDSLKATLGGESYLGQSYADVLSMLVADTSIDNYIYSMGKSSNPLIAASGTIIRDAQINRDEQLRQISDRIGKATKKLYDAGHTSEFMYASDGRIISDIAWESYAEERNRAIKLLKSQGLTEYAFKEALEQWEEVNTEDRVVDSVTGRTEKVPNSNYRLSHNPLNDLDAAQLEYYNTMMQIKGELGTLLPHYAQKHYLPPQIRKSSMDILSDGIRRKLSAKKVALLLWENLKSEIHKIREDDEDFITTNRYGDYDNTPLKDIPIFYFGKLKDNDELLRDFSSAIQSLAATAINYNAMSSIVEILETIQDLVGDLELRDDVDGKPSVDNISLLDRTINIVTHLRKKTTETKTKAILDSYVEMLVYNEKYKGNKKLNKIVNALLGYNSVAKLAVNTTGAIANVTAGELQMLIEAGGGEYFNIKNLLVAQTRIFGDLLGRTPGKVWDLLTNNRSSIDVLISEFFDTQQDVYSEKAKQRYHKNVFRRLFGKLDPLIMYSGGEYLIRQTLAYAVLDAEKVILNGKKVSLLKCFDKIETEKGFYELKLKDGVTKLDGSPLQLTDDYLKEVKNKIRHCSQACFGAMNSEDKGVINQHFLGRAAMNFRQWMVEHYSRRYRKRHWDYSAGKYVEGYYVTCFNVAKEFIKGYRDVVATYEMLKDTLEDDQKANLKKAGMEVLILLSLMGLSMCLGDEDDHDGEFFMRLWILNTKRMLQETKAAMPIGAITEFGRVIDSPFPAMTTVSGLLYPITGIKDIDDVIQRGRYKGWNKYWRNILWYTVPFYKQVDQLLNMAKENSMFAVYDRSAQSF